jgi:hypothetical protein
MSGAVNVANLSGANGGQYIADTSTYTATQGATKIMEIHAVTACVLDTVVGNVSGLDGTTIPAGDSAFGQFDSVILTSGTAYLYNASR